MGKGFFSNLSTPFTGIIEEALDTWLYYIRMYVRKRLVGPGIQSEAIYVGKITYTSTEKEWFINYLQ